MTANVEIAWLSHRRKAQCPSNPAYPHGIIIDVARTAAACEVDLPYPAECCGVFTVTCNVCKVSASVTAAGRADDPRKIRIPCMLEGRA